MEASTLEKLVRLASEKSSETRRELLHEVTDLFFESGVQPRQGAEAEHFDAILSSVTEEMTEEVRIEMAERFCDTPDAPRQLIRQLASDEPGIAAMVLRRSMALDDDDLITVAHSKGQSHLRAIAERTEVSTRVTDAVAARASDDTLAALIANDGAALSRRTMEKAVDRAQTAPALHAPLVNRQSLPADLMYEMYDFVETRLKEKILERNAALTDEQLDHALANARRKPAAAPGLPADYDAAHHEVQRVKLRKGLNAEYLASKLYAGEQTKLLVGFCDLAGLDFQSARAIFDNPSDEPLALVCKAAGLDRGFFVTLAISRAGDEGPNLSDAAPLRALYDKTPQEAAARVMRFWRLRSQASKKAA